MVLCKSQKSCGPRISVNQYRLSSFIVASGYFGYVRCTPAPASSQGSDNQQSKQNQKQPCANRITVSCRIPNHKTCTPEGEIVSNKVTVNDVAHRCHYSSEVTSIQCNKMLKYNIMLQMLKQHMKDQLKFLGNFRYSAILTRNKVHFT